MELKRVARSMFEARHAGCVCIIIYIYIYITLLYLIIIIYDRRYQLRLYTIFYIIKCFSTMHWKMLASFSFMPSCLELLPLRVQAAGVLDKRGKRTPTRGPGAKKEGSKEGSKDMFISFNFHNY